MTERLYRVLAGLPLWITSALLLVACETNAPTPPAAPRQSLSTAASAAAAPATGSASAASVSASAAPTPSGPPSPSPIPTPARTVTWTFEDTPAGRIDVVVAIPETAEPVPVLIALHGQGEAFKGPERGARGWIEDYALDRALERLAEPPLTRRDFQQITPRVRVEAINRALEAQPYQGLVVAMPYTPDILADSERSLDAGEPFGRFVVEQLLPRLAKDAPADLSRVAIDGVSLGGRMALLVGLAHPGRFATVASMQAAVYPQELNVLTGRAAKARAVNPSLGLRLLTSEGDFYRGTLGQLSKRWQRAGLDHSFSEVAGPHAYAFNRGPGAYEMLLFHDRTLRGQEPP